MKVFMVECTTGCSCCGDENHYRGPFATIEDAERRVKWYKAPNPEHNNPTASQYSKKGRYSIEDFDVEILPDGRCIIESRVYGSITTILVSEDGRNLTDALHYDVSTDYFCRSDEIF